MVRIPCVFAALLLAGCASRAESPGASGAGSTAVEKIASVSAVSASAAPKGGGEREPIELVTDPDALAVVEQKGAALGALLDGAPAPTAADLAKGRAYRAIADVIAREVRDAASADPQAGVGMTKAHRLFDAGF